MFRKYWQSLNSKPVWVGMFKAGIVSRDNKDKIRDTNYYHLFEDQYYNRTCKCFSTECFPHPENHDAYHGYIVPWIHGIGDHKFIDKLGGITNPRFAIVGAGPNV